MLYVIRIVESIGAAVAALYEVEECVVDVAFVTECAVDAVQPSA